MNLQKLERKDIRLIVICVAVSAVCLFVGAKYYFLAFPEASIEFGVTRSESAPLAQAFLSQMGLDTAGYRHASVFGFDDQAKTFLEREVGVDESNRLLATTVRLWRWRHRWFRPLQKEEMDVEVTTKGEVVGFRHLLAEQAKGAMLAQVEARGLAEKFLVETMGRPLDGLSFVEGSTENRPSRTDHSFTWKLERSEVKGADYRIEVGVAGDRISGYSERLKVPDTWIRDYSKLRSRNEVAGGIDAVLLILTVVAMLIFLVTRIRRGDVRWKAAAILGSLIFVLLSLSELNSFPSALYEYDTTTSFGGFLLGTILRALASGLFAGVLIFLLSASAEPYYRMRFPRLLSLTSILRRHSIRTREFFVASLVGITLTFFFFAYENVFYIIANSLGAWAPRDVAYSDLLSTAFPWVYVLFFGFLPAISEEFISRMFSVPFFEKILRSTPAAIIVAAFIWGFGHAGYPNQPFWIRGLEVGLAGIVFGIVLLRFGIVAVVICHFSVDALYTAFVMIRSPNPYYMVSGALSAGIFLVLFLAAAIAYKAKGGFLPAEGTNEAEGSAASPAASPAAVPPVSPQAAYEPLTRRRIGWGIVLAALLAALGLVHGDRFGDWVDLKLTRETARDSAERFLLDNGFDVSRYRSSVQAIDRTDRTAAAYLLEKGGLGAAKRFYERLVPTPLYQVRFFVPSQHEEYSVLVMTSTGAVAGFTRALPENAPGATVPTSEARAIAERFLLAHGVDPRAGELKEQTEKEEKARRDHTLVWELAEAGAGEAKARYAVVVQGNAVGSWTREVKVPEEWRRNREKETALTEGLSLLKIPYVLLFIGAALLLLVKRIRGGDIAWKPAFLIGGAAAALTLLRRVLTLDNLWAQYDTSIPAAAYGVQIAISLLMPALGLFLAGTLVGALAAALHRSVATTLTRAARRVFARDALIAGFVTLGVAFGLPALSHLLETLVPGGLMIAGVRVPGGADARIPFLYAFGGAGLFAIFLPATAAVVIGLLDGYFRRRFVRVLLAAFFVLSYLPGEARRPSEYLVGAMALILFGAGALLIIRLFLVANPLAWLWSAYFTAGVRAAESFLRQSGPFYRVNGLLIMLAVLVPAVWLLRDAIAGSRAARIAESGGGPLP